MHPLRFLFTAFAATACAALLSSCSSPNKRTIDQRLGTTIPPKKGRSYNPAHDVTDQRTTLIANVGGVPVYRHTASNAVIWKHGLSVDADGSPKAYAPPPRQGLDYLADAGHPGNWWALVTTNGREDGQPVVQGRSDPAPGYYVSTTSLQNPSYPSADPRHWVNASSVPYIVLPLEHHDFGGRLGDYGAAVNLSNGKVAYVIVADLGPVHHIGEGSVALAKALGVNPSPRDGGVGDGIEYIFFPNSGEGVVKTPAQIARAAATHFASFGGKARLAKVINAQ